MNDGIQPNSRSLGQNELCALFVHGAHRFGLARIETEDIRSVDQSITASNCPLHSTLVGHISYDHVRYLDVMWSQCWLNPIGRGASPNGPV